MRRASRLRACVTASPVAGGGRPAERGRVDAPSGRCVRRGRTAVKPPNPVDGPEHACGVLLGTRGEPSPKPRDPRQRPWGSTLRALRQGGQRLGRWCDGQRTTEQRGARTPAHAKVGGAMVLAGQACCGAPPGRPRATPARRGARPGPSGPKSKIWGNQKNRRIRTKIHENAIARFKSGFL